MVFSHLLSVTRTGRMRTYSERRARSRWRLGLTIESKGNATCGNPRFVALKAICGKRVVNLRQLATRHPAKPLAAVD